MIGWMMACSGPTTPDTTTDQTDQAPIPTATTADTGEVTLPVVLTGPTVLDPDDPGLRLVKLLSVTSDVATRLSVVLDDGDSRRRLTFPDLATEHRVPLLGLLADTDHTATLTLTAEGGGMVEGEVAFRTAALEERLPKLDLLVAKPDTEPGYRGIALSPTQGQHLILVVDRQARPRWAHTTVGPAALQWHPRDGAFSWLVANTTIVRIRSTGEDRATWTVSDEDPSAIRIQGLSGLHHEVVFVEDGSFWTLHQEKHRSEDYPQNVLRPEVTAPTDIDADVITHVAPDGSVLQELHLVELLDDNRIGFDAQPDPFSSEDPQWSHTNGLAVLPDEHALVVSLRNQDTVFRIDTETEQIEWILANPDGWDPKFEPLRLQPVGAPFGWNYHQHAPFVLDDGGLLLFDNGNYGRTTPYSQDPTDPIYTRLVQFQVDPTARTVRQLREWIPPYENEPLFCNVLGNADRMPTTGNVFGTFAALTRQDGVQAEALGLGSKMVRLIEFSEAGDVVWDLRIASDRTVQPDGYKVDRAIQLPTLYGEDVVEELLP